MWETEPSQHHSAVSQVLEQPELVSVVAGTGAGAVGS